MASEIIIKSNPPKRASLDAFAIKLVDKIMHASGEDEIGRYVAVAVRSLGNKKINGYIIQRFIDRVARYLDGYEPIGEQQQQNSRVAKHRLQEFRRAVATGLL